MPLSNVLAAVYVYLIVRRLGYSQKVGLVTTLLTGLTTMVWPYTYDLMVEPLISWGFAATLYYALAYRQDKRLSQIPGQLLIEDASIIPPPDLPAGVYHLQIGFLIPVVEAGELIFPLPPEMTEVRIVPQLKSL